MAPLFFLHALLPFKNTGNPESKRLSVGEPQKQFLAVRHVHVNGSRGHMTLFLQDHRFCVDRDGSTQ